MWGAQAASKKHAADTPLESSYAAARHAKLARAIGDEDVGTSARLTAAHSHQQRHQQAPSTSAVGDARHCCVSIGTGAALTPGEARSPSAAQQALRKGGRSPAQLSPSGRPHKQHRQGSAPPNTGTQHDWRSGHAQTGLQLPVSSSAAPHGGEHGAQTAAAAASRSAPDSVQPLLGPTSGTQSSEKYSPYLIAVL